MDYRRLGSSGVRVSRISLGSWLTIGNQVAQSATNAMVGRAVDLGINFFDTADVYNDGAAERALGQAIKGLRRDHLIIASKCFFPMSDDVNDRGLSRKHIIESIHGSLRRLELEHLDLYQCHRPDPDTPVAETAMAMDDLIRQGKVLYWGVSYWPAHRIVEAVQFCRANGCHPPVSNQPPYNLLNRTIEDEVIGVCREQGLSQVVFSPLAQGVLSGKYRPGAAPPAGSRASNRKVNQFISRYLTEDALARVARFVEIAERASVTPSQLALQWCLRLPEVSSAIIGASSIEQLEENVAALDSAGIDEVAAELDELFPGPRERDLTT